VVFAKPVLDNGKPTGKYEPNPEYRGWTARVEGGSVFVRPAHQSTGEVQPEEFEFPRAQVAIKWDRTEEAKADAARAAAEAAKNASKADK
jgi:hypothetical protein